MASCGDPDCDRPNDAHLVVQCADCLTEWIAPYGGRFECPNCETESVQQFLGGFVGLDGPHSFVGQVYPGDDEWPH
jgi:hypothetical protein